MEKILIGTGITIILTLTGVIWHMLNVRINKLEKEQGDTREKLFEKMDSLTKAFNSFQIGIAKEMMTREECDRRHPGGE